MSSPARFFAATALVAFAFAGTRADADDAPDEANVPKKRRYVVAAMGDSLTDPRSKGGKYLTYLAKRCPKSTFDSYGVGGNMVNQMRRRFARDLFNDPPEEGDEPKPPYTHLLVLGGINDICSDESAHRSNDKIKTDLGWMYTEGKRRGLDVIALTLPPWAGFKKYYNRRRARSTFSINSWIKTQRKSGRIDLLLDVYPLLSCGHPEHLCDRYGWNDKVHWSSAGHKVVGQALYQTIFADCE